MTLQEVTNFLIEKPGYLKWGEDRLAERLNVEPKLVAIAMEAIKNEDLSVIIKDIPKILFLDIETSPMLAFIWNTWKTDVYAQQLEADWFMISWVGKWLGSDFTFGAVLTPEEILEEDDSRIVKELWKTLEEADIVIAHNGDKFDIKKINTRFIRYGLGPVSPYKSIDTLKVAKKNFAFTYNSLDELAKFFGIKGKNDTNFELWRRCLKGDPVALVNMYNYNAQDVNVLEQVYYKLRPWISNHPNLGLYMIDTEHRCTNCHSPYLVPVGYSTTSISKFTAYRCENCGAISRGRSTLLSTVQNKSLLTNG